ncbi:uncharacterized protein LOC113311744 [Papaver somniferum]|uniref:uncharacterized protein LOC113311744 n=1 Tax=Papaver somniferum TaxID=3469 RepID=UPI000E704B34|nr:uncharacterized protein LOC113311744 [Papaver somniferum]
MENFGDFISQHDLIDLPLKGARYIWSNGQSNHVMCRLDRFLISPAFESHFPFVSQLAKSRPTSDHIPILLDISDPSWGPSPFRFEIMWFLENGFIELLENWWTSFCFTGTSSTILWCKLKALKEKLKEWNKLTFGNTNIKLNLLLSEIQDLDSLAEDTLLSDSQMQELVGWKKDFERVTRMKEVSWRIKSNTRWLQEGDKNTAFFIRKTSAKRRYDRIKKLYIDGALVDDRQKLQEHIVSFYENLFREEEIIKPVLEGINFDNINSIESGILDADFSEAEILQAIQDLDHDKAPGPGGFPIMFFHKCWSFIKTDIMGTMKEFCDTKII